MNSLGPRNWTYGVVFRLIINPAMQGKPFYIAISFTGVAVWQSHTGYYLLPPMLKVQPLHRHELRG